jgi:putative hydrolase of the HAD superfamily
VSIWVYTDADNTLWDTNALFAEAQLALLGAAEEFCRTRGPDSGRLKFVRTFDQAIAANHHQRLRYPPALLFRALCDGLRGLSPEVAAKRALTEGAVLADSETQALRAYSDAISNLPPLLGGVREGLQLAHEHRIPVYVVTEGPLETVRARLRAHGVDALTAGTLSASKTQELYARLRQRAEPHRSVMIGDQPDRDTRLAHDAGLLTVLIQGRFRPNWLSSADAKYADTVVRNFHEGIGWVLRLGAPSTP